MQCANQWCIYWSDESCTLQSISLDMRGMCADCIELELPLTLLDDFRRKKVDEL